MPSLTRRDFARLSASGMVGLWMGGCTDPVGLEDTPGLLAGNRRSKEVIVVGAGLAGLVAAYELSRAGHDVRVLEARGRVGGRVLTLRRPFPDGQLAEAGAARIRPEHDLTLGYLAHFRLPTDPFYPRSGDFLDVADGRRERRSSDSFRAARPDYVKLRGGTDALPEALAAALSGSIELDAAVTRIAHTSAGARVSLASGAALEAERVLVTVPLTVLGGIEFDPGLSPAKTAAAAGGFRYQAATRVFVRFRSRFWETDGLNGWAETDWPEELWHPTWDVAGPEGVLLSYVRGDRALDLDRRTEQDRTATVLAHWESVFPGVTDEAIGGVSHSWQDDPWSRFAWAAPTSTQDLELSGEIGRAEGPLHFAGEHASAHRGWMQGALESGIRAAREIHDG